MQLYRCISIQKIRFWLPQAPNAYLKICFFGEVRLVARQALHAAEAASKQPSREDFINCEHGSECLVVVVLVGVVVSRDIDAPLPTC